MGNYLFIISLSLLLILIIVFNFKNKENFNLNEDFYLNNNIFSNKNGNIEFIDDKTYLTMALDEKLNNSKNYFYLGPSLNDDFDYFNTDLIIYDFYKNHITSNQFIKN